MFPRIDLILTNTTFNAKKLARHQGIRRVLTTGGQRRFHTFGVFHRASYGTIEAVAAISHSCVIEPPAESDSADSSLMLPLPASVQLRRPAAALAHLTAPAAQLKTPAPDRY